MNESTKSPYQHSPATEEQKRAKGFKKRDCLRCGKAFLSGGFGNRVCAPCQERNDLHAHRAPSKAATACP